MPFFRRTLQKLTSFQEGILIVGGDFNIPLNPLHDTSSGSSKLPFKALHAIKKYLQELTLHDSWRTLNPKTKDYFVYSNPHGRYSRLDYLFLSQRDLPMLLKANIEPMFISDHHPITMSIEFMTAQSHSPIWHLDPSILTDILIASTIHNRLTQDNDAPEISPMIKWKAHECTIQGELIAIATKRRRERQAHISKLSNHIHELEKAHKKTQAISSLQELTQARTELVDELNKRMKHNYILSQKLFYEYGNKAGRLLARAV